MPYGSGISITLNILDHHLNLVGGTIFINCIAEFRIQNPNGYPLNLWHAHPCTFEQKQTFYTYIHSNPSQSVASRAWCLSVQWVEGTHAYGPLQNPHSTLIWHGQLVCASKAQLSEGVQRGKGWLGQPATKHTHWHLYVSSATQFLKPK